MTAPFPPSSGDFPVIDRVLRKHLRPMLEPSVSTMNASKHYFRNTLLSAIAALVLLLAWTNAAHAKAPIPPGAPAACVKIWQVAPNGTKWARFKRCLDRYCAKVTLRVPRNVTVKGERVDRNQRHVLGWIVNEGKRRKLPRVFVVSAIATTTQEASAREINYGHGTSVGPFQLIDIHGPRAKRRTIEFSGNWFYNGAKKVYRRGMGAVELSHRVQRSAYPTAVVRWIPEARRSLKIILGPCNYTLR